MNILWMIGVMVLWSGCSASLDTTSSMQVQMYGSNQTPEGATGNTNPISMDYTLAEVSLLSEDGSQSFVFYDGTDPAKTRVVSRPQIIYEELDIADYIDTTFSSISMTFSTTVTAISKNSEDHTLTLATPTVELVKEFTFETGKDYLFYCKVHWKNTVTDTSISEPQLEITLSE